MVLAAVLLVSVGCKKQKPPDLTRIWLGKYHGCALAKDGTLECWGANDVGQLGDSTKEQRIFPVKLARAADDVAIGTRHTCFVSKGQVSCVGDSAHGQLEVPALTAKRIEAGGDRTCASSDEGLTCWGGPGGGRGTVGAFAVGPSGVCAAWLSPKRVECTGMEKPILVGAGVKQLTLGGGHGCALLDDGSVQCWGKNDSGQLGDGTTNDAAQPVLVSALPATAEIRAGERHTCARLANATVACWGDNRAHQLANGTTTPSARPYPVVGLVGVQELALGGDSSCARLAEGGARCWGSNVAGQLGDGTVEEHPVPMPIRSPR